MDLFEALQAYRREDIYPFHMPGHKRNPIFDSWQLPFDRDITEIHGFDHLHHPTGILKEAMAALSELYGTLRSLYCVNGSTGGILAAVSAAVPRGGRLLMARNCHNSVYHAVYLRDLDPVYVYPEPSEWKDCSGDISPEQIRSILKREKDISAVILTSPTYEGIVSDVRSVSEICHDHQIPLIVDEAHGAHMRFSDYFPVSAVDCGADIVIHSLHKTLPSLTQTAVVHLCSDRVEADRLAYFMELFQTSSPSYILMESMSHCIRYLKEEGPTAFDRYTELLDRTRDKLAKLQNICLVRPDHCFDVDRSKLYFSIQGGGMSGYRVADRLREEYGLEFEMASSGGLLAMTSVGDREEGFDRLVDALFHLDACTDTFRRDPESKNGAGSDHLSDPAGTESGYLSDPAGSNPGTLPYPVKVRRPAEAMEGQRKQVFLNACAEEISGEFVYLYPPGIPLLVPGERISRETAAYLEVCREEGIKLHGLCDPEGKRIMVL